MTNYQLMLTAKNAAILAGLDVVTPGMYLDLAAQLAPEDSDGFITRVTVDWGLESYVEAVCPNAVAVFFFEMPRSQALQPIWVVDLPLDAPESEEVQFYRSVDGKLLFIQRGDVIPCTAPSTRTMQQLEKANVDLEPSEDFCVLQRSKLTGRFTRAAR